MATFSRIKQAWHYWRENIETATGGFDMSVLIATAVLAWSSSLSRLLNSPNPIERFIASSQIADWSEAGAITIFSVWCFLWLPFRRHQMQATTMDLISNRNELERIKADTRKIVKDTLGLYLESIEGRIMHVNRIDVLSITDKELEKELFAWSDMKVEIGDFLKRNFSGMEAAYFESSSGVNQTPLDDNDDSPTARERKRQLHFLLDQMAHESKQIKMIIEKKMQLENV